MSFVNVVHAPESGGLYREIYLEDEDNKSDMPADFIMHFAVLFIVFSILNIEQSCGGLRCSLVGT